jgi:osmotically-inducible protein OsmY
MTDAQLEQAVLEEINKDRSLSSQPIEVRVHQQQVTLSGVVEHYANRHAAEHAAYRVHQIKQVVNRIEVRPPGTVGYTDAAIARSAQQALKRDAYIPGDRLTVSVLQGWVTLEGEVDYTYQEEEAERDVAYLDGVKGVSNLLTVRTPDEVSPTM